MFIVCAPVGLAGCFSLHIAATLGQNIIAEAMNRIVGLKQETGKLVRSQSSAKESEWRMVEAATLRLATDTMPCVSTGWSGLVVGVWGVAWISALCCCGSHFDISLRLTIN
jgi:hypothetical protein